MTVAVRVGVVGVGAMGAAHVETLARYVAGARVVAVADADGARAAALAAETGDVRVCEGDELVAAADVDAVVVASSDETHERLAVACLDAGKPVLCEKPLAASADGCLRVVEREVRGGRRLVQVGFMRRFDASYAELKRSLDDGAVGAPLLLHCVHRNAAAPPFFTAAMPVLSSAVHEIDVARWLLSTEVTRVSVHTPRSTSRAAAGLVDPRLLVLETACGVTVDVEVFVNAGYGYDVRCELVGETGTVSLAPPVLTTRRSGGTEGAAVPASFLTWFAAAYRTELQAWVDAVGEGEQVGPSAWDGYAATAVAEACLAAADRGESVDVRLQERPVLYA